MDSIRNQGRTRESRKLAKQASMAEARKGIVTNFLFHDEERERKN